MSGSGVLDVPKTEDFFSTALGLVTLAIVVFIVTSVVWLVGIIICYCCCRYHQRYQSTSETEPSTNVYYPPDNNETLDTSARETVNFSYSLNSLAHEPAFKHTSLESILSGELDKQDGNIT